MFLKEKVESCYHQFSMTNQEVADQVLITGPDLQYYSVAKFANQCHVSTSMIIKFAKSLDLTGFDELKFLAKYSFMRPDDSDDTDTSRIIHSLENTHIRDSIQRHQLATRLHDAGNIHVFARSSSANIAFDFYYKLKKVRSNVFFYREFKDQVSGVMDVRSDDLVFLVSNSGNSRELIAIAKSLRNRDQIKPLVILVSNNPTCQLIGATDISLIGIPEEHGLHYPQDTPFTAKYTLMYILDTLYFEYFFAYQEECDRAVARFRRLIAHSVEQV